MNLCHICNDELDTQMQYTNSDGKTICETCHDAIPRSKKRCALVIGHKAASPGAANEDSYISEFNFNKRLAKDIQSDKVYIVPVYRKTYARLPNEINAIDPDFIISLHCNAFNKQASGSETLYYHKSRKGRRMAEIVQKHITACLKLVNRGIKPKSAEDRGGYLLRYTKAPCVIAEPFFIDNDNDLIMAIDNFKALAQAYTKAIEEIADVI